MITLHLPDLLLDTAISMVVLLICGHIISDIFKRR